MQALISAETGRIKVRDAASCREWLGHLVQEGGDHLAAIERLLRSLAQSRQAPDLLFEIAEQVRAVHLRELDSRAAGLRGAVFPMPEPCRHMAATVAGALAQGRDLFARLHTQLQDDSDAPSHTVIPGTTHTLRAILPLVRALDYQCRLILFLQANRMEVVSEEWDLLCTYAAAIRASSFLDVALPDECPLLPSPTARALFVCPLLSALAGPDGLTEPEHRLVARLARRWAARVGFRLEPGYLTVSSPNGPVLGLSTRYSVRLENHKLMRRLQARREEVGTLDAAGAMGLPRGMTLAATRTLFERLSLAWAAGRVQVPLLASRLGEMRLRFGFPQAETRRGDPPPAQGLAFHERSGSVATGRPAVSQSYVYGRFEANSVIREALGEPPAEDLLARWASQAERMTWVAIEHECSYFEREFAAPIALGDLVTLVPPAPAELPALPMGQARPASFICGRVVSLSQRLNPDLSLPARQRIGVAAWSGAPSLVAVRGGDDPFFHDAVLLAAAGEPETLLLPNGRLTGQPTLTLREPARDTRLRIDSVLETGVGFQRVLIHRLEN